MKSSSGSIRLSASDLSNHLACHHLTALDLEVVTGQRSASDWHSPDAWVLQQRGLAHENAYVEHLESQGLSITNLRDSGNDEQALLATASAIRAGAEVILQGALAKGSWFGRPDVLRKVQQPSQLGSWSYEVYDCKLARETKAATILQLSLYSELLDAIQGLLPQSMYVVTPGESFTLESHRVLDYAAYYRYIKTRLETAVIPTSEVTETYPEPTPHCEVCSWRPHCEAVRREDDHLSLVAGISRLQRKQLRVWETTTVADLARFPLPIQQSPDHGSKEGLVRVREQARVQVSGRAQAAPVHEILEVTDEHGLCLLPEPSQGDVFFDLEGDPFVGMTGREYLFGLVLLEPVGDPKYESRWALNIPDEKAAFEWFVQLIMERWARYPSMHIYHFASYEPSALKRLMGRHAVCEDQIDQMLRANLFVDLHRALKRSVRASVEQYSLKALEAFHGFKRTIPLEQAGSAMRQLQHQLELARAPEVADAVKEAILFYNADDCLSAMSLRDWLETVRQQVEQEGKLLTRPALADPAPPEAVSERQERSAALARTLTANIPNEPEARSEEQSAACLLANLLDWHRREAKAEWWELFRLQDLTDEDLIDERSAISGLEPVETLQVIRKIPTDRYRFARQETDIRSGDKVCNGDNKIGEVVAIDVVHRTIDIKKMKKTADVHPTSVFVDPTGPNNDVLADALFRLGSWVSTEGVNSEGPYRAARDLLLRRQPRLLDGAAFFRHAEESTVDAAKRLVGQLDHTVLAIQGPPGAGKTFTGARMICELVSQGKRVGVTATSHKVIRNLLDEVVIAAQEANITGLGCFQKVSDKSEEDDSSITEITDNSDALAALQEGGQVLGGTAWMWAREDFRNAVDVIFIDEAGQMSLANVLAISQTANSLVLLGDPQQLEQPLKGSHPDGAEVSALHHFLAGAKTLPPDRGLFLEQTWRLHPKLCEFTSEVFYESRLSSHPGLERQQIVGHPWLGAAGLWFIPVRHEGNQNTSREEQECVARIVDTLIQPSVLWVNDKGASRQLEIDDILIVAPYNAQVSDLSARLPSARIGTVDKFQGQQAPVVIYSLTTSAPEDAPRGMEFLYSLNRLNVATSRAQAVVIVVGSTLLLEPECQSPRQMQLANALCRYAELSTAEILT